MITTDSSVPIPDLRILSINNIQPHEEHDPQRAAPLIEKLRHAEWFTNPPIVAPMDDGQFVVLDGANRYHCFKTLGFEHLLVQVAPYDSDFVQLGVWQHIVSDWDNFLAELEQLPDITIQNGWDGQATAQILLHNGSALTMNANTDTVEDRNAALRRVVGMYRDKATLYRTAITDPTAIWALYPDAVALVLFPHYEPADIIAAARHQAYLPPGVSRHVIHGRALSLNYPMKKLYDTTMSLGVKNDVLQSWVRDRLAQRNVRYYAESTYQFSE